MIRIICLGKLKEDYLKEAVSDYLKRLTNYHKVEIIELKDNESIIEEEKEILNVLNNKSFKIALDIKGISTSSEELATLIDKKLMEYANIDFIIGSSNGLSSNILSQVNMKISFGAITLPHGLFRVVLLEQVYRAFKILNNERYHK